VAAGFVHVQHFVHTLTLEQDSAVELPESRRGYSRGKARTQRQSDEERAASQAELRAFDDGKIDAALNGGYRKAWLMFSEAYSGNAAAVRKRLSRDKVYGVDFFGTPLMVPASFFRLENTNDADVADETFEAEDEDEDEDDADDAEMPLPLTRSELAGMNVADLKEKLLDSALSRFRNFTNSIFFAAESSRRTMYFKTRLRRRAIGLKVGGVKRELIDRLVSHESTGEAALEAQKAVAEGSSKKAMNKRRFVVAVEAALQEVEGKVYRETTSGAAKKHSKAPRTVEALFRKTLLYAEHLNARFSKLSRERTGVRSRFTGQEVHSADERPNSEITKEHRALCGRVFDDRDGRWRIVSSDDEVLDDDGIEVDGVFFDTESDPNGIFVVYYSDDVSNPGISDLEVERYESLLESSTFVDDE